MSLRLTARRRSPRSRHAPPADPGVFGVPLAWEPLWLVSGKLRLRGRMAGGTEDRLGIELEAHETKLKPGTRGELEWVGRAGIVRRSARLAVTGLAGCRQITVELQGAPLLVQRREHVRVPADLAATTWSLLDPTQRLQGRAINVSEGGALLELPGLSPAAGHVDIVLSLPLGAVQATARIVRRDSPTRVAVSFAAILPEGRRALREFVVAQLGGARALSA